MSRKSIPIIICILIALLSAFIIGKTKLKGSTSVNPSPYTSKKQDQTVPEPIIYGFLFSKVSRISEKTRELRAKGKIGQKPYFPLQREAGLNEGQATALEAIASACQQKVARLDEKANEIIRAFQAQFPEGRVPKTGSPPVPQELQTMWEERNAIILKARDQLRAAFGEEAFARFDDYTKFHYGKNKAPVKINPISLNKQQPRYLNQVYKEDAP